MANDMGKRIALVEHDRPRVLMLDFSDSDAKKLRDLGYNARRSDSGLYNREKFSIPWSVQDVEIVLANVARGTFSKLHERTADPESVEKTPASFVTLLKETWWKGGYLVFFIKRGSDPLEFDRIGINALGVLEQGRMYYPRTALSEFLTGLSKVSKSKDAPALLPTFPIFSGDALTANHEAGEYKIISRYLGSAEFSVLTTGKPLDELWGGRNIYSKNLIQDESTNQNALAVKIEPLTGGSYYGGAVLFLPDFGKNNIEVAVGIIQQVIAERNNYLFDSPHHPWLESYLPFPVQEIRAEKTRVISLAQDTLSELADAESKALEEYSWLLGLLTSSGNEFRDHAATALRVLGFDVVNIDAIVAPGEALREDLHVTDRETGFFAIGETKSTLRGASEGFLTDVQNHQGRYSRENKVPIPNAILIVNHSTELDPAIRTGRFYQNPDIPNRCAQQGITAVDSVALFQMCQCVIQQKVTAVQIRQFIESKHQVLARFKI